VAHAAIGQLFGVNLVLLDEFASKRGLIGRDPVQIKNLLARADEFLRCAMTFQAPFHVERVGLPGERHLIELPVARRATDAVIHMDAVVEKNKIRRGIDARPAQWLLRGETFANGREQWRVLPDLRMAGHADFRRGNSGKRGFLDGCMAESAIEAESGDVMLVAEGDRLFERDVLARRPRRPVNRVQNSAAAGDQKNPGDNAAAGNGIGAPPENLRHRFSTNPRRLYPGLGAFHKVNTVRPQ
jgi:hypothetical protein